MTEKVLPYDRNVVPQETGWDCGPASTQIVLNSLGIIATEQDLIREIGTTTNGTDDISWIENRSLDRRLPQALYTRVYIRNDPPTASQVDDLWANVRRSIDAGYGVIMNWVAPPGNHPVGVKGSVSPSYGGGTIYHYVACMGYSDENGQRALWIADSGFRPFGYWVSLDQAASLIATKGYCYAAVGAPAPTQPAPLSLRDQHALDIINEGRRRGITPRGIVIALATGLVESNITIYANAKVPASMAIPHEAIGSDGYSVGIFQQQVVWGANGWWWGDAATCMDPVKSAGLFYDRLARLDYNGPNSPGSYAQAVQKSDYPSRYDERMADAQALYDRLVTAVTDGWEQIMALKVKSKSIYAPPGEDAIPVEEMVAALDAHGPHEPYIEGKARKGDPEALRLLVTTAAGRNQYGAAPFAVNQALDVLAEISGKSRDEIRQQIQKGQLA